MWLTGLTTSRRSLGVCCCTTLLGRRSRRSGRRRSFQILGPCLTSGRTWIPPAGQRYTKASTSTCKKPTIPTRLLSRPGIGRQTPPPGLTMWSRSGGHVPRRLQRAEWDKYIAFWNDPRNLARAAQNWLNRQKSVIVSRQGSRSLARLQNEMRQASDTQEYPSLIDTYWRTHC